MSQRVKKLPSKGKSEDGGNSLSEYDAAASLVKIFEYFFYCFAFAFAPTITCFCKLSMSIYIHQTSVFIYSRL